MGYVQKLLEDWNGSASILNATGTKKPDLIIYSDASGTEGFGFLEIQSLRFGTGKWKVEDLKDAHREKESSSTYLEILAIAIAIRSLAKKHMAIEVRCQLSTPWKGATIDPRSEYYNRTG